MNFSASLPMYNLPEMADANAQFWRVLRKLIAGHGLTVGGCELDHKPRADSDRVNTNIIFTQTCGYPLVRYLRGQASILATPCYGMAGCDGPYHRAFFVVRADERATRLDDLRGRIFGCNSLRSNTGMNLPRLSLARIANRKRFFSAVVITGGHVWSLEHLVSGCIDVCSVDCVTWGFLERFRPGLTAQARILAETDQSPCLPFVTSAATSSNVRAALRQTLDDVFEDPQYTDLRASLALNDVAHLEDAAYEKLLEYERHAGALGYPEIK